MDEQTIILELIKFVRDFTGVSEKLRASLDILVKTFEHTEKDVEKISQTGEVTLDMTKKIDLQLQEMTDMLEDVVDILVSDKDGIRKSVHDVGASINDKKELELAKVAGKYSARNVIILVITNLVTGVLAVVIPLLSK